MPAKSSRNKRRSGGHDSLPALTSLTSDQLMARRWKKGLPESADYFYDEEVKDVLKKPKDFPPDNLELSDAWVVTIVNSKLSREERGDAWPAVFTLRGVLRAQYLHKGQPAKLYDPETKAIKYALLFGEHNMIGTEGMIEGLPAKRPTPLDDAEPITQGLWAQVQDLSYDVKEVEAEASTTRKSAGTEVVKKITTSRSTGFTAVNHPPPSDVKESEAGSEDDEPDMPTTRHSKRIMEKEASEPGRSASKRQKTTAEEPSKPMQGAPSPLYSDSWAASTPRASATKSHHGRLLPMLTPKAQDNRQLEMELATAAKRIEALQKVNEALKEEAAEAKRTELGTRPLMARLMSTARTSQGTLTKLVAAIANYHLTMDEKDYLHSLARDNDVMTEQLQKDLPHFFDRIFIDSDQEFNTWAKAIADSADKAGTQTNSPAPGHQSKRALQAPAYSLPTKPAANSPKTSTPTQAARHATPVQSIEPAATPSRPWVQPTNPPLLTARSERFKAVRASPQADVGDIPSLARDRVTVAAGPSNPYAERVVPETAPGTPQPSAPTNAVRAARDGFLARLAPAKDRPVDPVDSSTSAAQKAQETPFMSDATKEAHDRLWGRVRRMPTATTTIPNYRETENAAPPALTTAADSATPMAQGAYDDPSRAYDPFTDRVEPLGDEDHNSGSEFHPDAADEDDEDDVPMTIGEEIMKERNDYKTWFGKAQGMDDGPA